MAFFRFHFVSLKIIRNYFDVSKKMKKNAINKVLNWTWWRTSIIETDHSFWNGRMFWSVLVSSTQNFTVTANGLCDFFWWRRNEEYSHDGWWCSVLNYWQCYARWTFTWSSVTSTVLFCYTLWINWLSAQDKKLNRDKTSCSVISKESEEGNGQNSRKTSARQ